MDSFDYFERFLSPTERATATNELAELGTAALPILELLFTGKAKNNFGVPYNELIALDCGYITCKLLGVLAKPLENYIRVGIQKNHPYAIEAAGKLMNLEEKTIIALAEALNRNPFGNDAAYVLVQYNEHKNVAVKAIVKDNKEATLMIGRAENYLNKKL